MSPSSPKATTLLMMLLAVLGLMQSARPVLASNGVAAEVLVRGISIHDGPGGTVAIDISITHSVPYRTIQLSRPERLVVDLKGAREANLKNEYPAQSLLLERVRAGQWKSDPAVVRIVADLKGNPSFSVKTLDSGIRIELSPQAEAKGEGHGAHSADAKSSGGASEPIRETAHHDPPGTAFQVHRFKDLSASLTAPVLPPHDRLIPLADPHLTAPSRNAAAGPALVSGISIQPDSKGDTTIDIASSRPVPYRVSQLAHPFRLVIDLKDARDASGEKVYPVNSPLLKTVRIGPSSRGNTPGVQVVADLEGYPVFDVYAHRPGIRIELKPRRDPAGATRNPFRFRLTAQQTGVRRPALPPHNGLVAGGDPPAAAPESDFSTLALIGLIEKNGGGTQAVISGRSGVYVVSKGDTFENSFTVVAISTKAVEVQDTTTLATRWIAYSQ